jgi:poly(A) polymerase
MAMGTTLAQQQSIIAIPRRFSQFVRDVWGLQHRLESRRPRTVDTLLEHERFRAAYDFLVLRSEAGEEVAEAAQWWTRIQEADTAGRRTMIEALTSGSPADAGGGKKRRRKRRKTRTG